MNFADVIEVTGFLHDNWLRAPYSHVLAQLNT